VASSEANPGTLSVPEWIKARVAAEGCAGSSLREAALRAIQLAAQQWPELRHELPPDSSWVWVMRPATYLALRRDCPDLLDGDGLWGFRVVLSAGDQSGVLDFGQITP
jgi:hypothetical protein